MTVSRGLCLAACHDPLAILFHRVGAEHSGTVVGRFSLRCVGAERVETVVGQAFKRVNMQKMSERRVFWWFPLLFALCSITTRLDSMTISFSDHLTHSPLLSSSSHLWTSVRLLRRIDRFSELNESKNAIFNSKEFAFHNISSVQKKS